MRLKLKEKNSRHSNTVVNTGKQLIYAVRVLENTVADRAVVPSRFRRGL